ncbi:GNAT family N-acetyltransferase [Lysobacter korlensis]|uniref:GNAT family N-acetyltransferase n=1 Tax=Lysobacter korlensis TaxID=553636 RepID=A0ABV6RIQ6_9GAMM
MRFERSRFSEQALARYASLFAACFPTAHKLQRIDYLRWLYLDNPLGEAVGFDAFDGERLAAHYICTRAQVSLEGRPGPALLSLNTATHPDFQGRGLFTKLAELTYETGASEGSGFVYGVANANSTPGFLRKLGFGLVAPLEARFGVGPLGRFDWERIAREARFRQAWTPEYLRWRLANPANPVAVRVEDGRRIGVSAATGTPMLEAWAEIPAVPDLRITPRRGAPSARLWLGLMPQGAGRLGLFPPVPSRLRPSPLNLIFKPLAGGPVPRSGEVAFSFLDFDAF